MVGDQASVSFKLSQGLVELGEEVWQLLPDKEFYRVRFPKDLEEAKVHWAKGGLAQVLRKAIYLIRTLDIDLVHTHWLSSFGVSGSIACRLCEACHVAHLHGGDIRRARDGVESEIRNRLGASYAQMFLLSTPDLSDWCFFRTPSAYLPSPIDMRFFRRVPQNETMRASLARGRKHIILCPARFDLERKNQDLLVRAIRDDSFEDVQTIFLSTSRSQAMSSIKRMCAELGISDRVSFVIGVPYRQMPFYYDAADVVALAFTFGVYGCAVLESMACETPVVSYFDYSRFGRHVHSKPPIINARSVPEISSSIGELLGDYSLRRTIGAKSRRWVAENHSLERVSRELRARYRRILGENPSPRASEGVSPLGGK